MTLVAPLSFPESISANSTINALDFQPGTGILFASSPTGIGVNSLLKIDTAEGTVTVVGSGTTQTGLDAIAFFFPPAASITATGGTP